jgi:hypothetical protein
MGALSGIERPTERHDAVAAASEARLKLLIASGGDDRIWLDPATRRNRYGAPAAPAPDELWFSSSTASAISPRGWSAAGEALDALVVDRGRPIDVWFDDLRARLKALYGAPGAETVLSASGTEAELVALKLALAIAEGPLTNIVVAPAETGSGVPAAADGRHFLGRASLGGLVTQGERLAGWRDAPIRVETLEIRSDWGAPRARSEVDAEAASRVEAAVARGAFVLLHVLDASKTGRPGVGRAAAKAILDRHPARVLVVVDACQLRCPAEAIRADLEDGFAVMITGSKFAGGPAFCGALLLPKAIVERAAAAPAAASPLAAYSALLDWPARLRPAFAPGLVSPANLGLGLRWSAALAEIEAFHAISPTLRDDLLDRFDRAVRDRVATDRGLALLDPRHGPAAPGLIPVNHADGSDPRRAYLALQTPGRSGERPCHLGQPVALGPMTALRVCASMPMIARAAEQGFASLEADLDELFASWSRRRA